MNTGIVKSWLAGATSLALLSLPSSATALSELTFQVVGGTGSITHTVAADPLFGSTIEIGSIQSLSSPVHSGVTLPCVSCELSFSTGNRLSYTLSGATERWVFDHTGSAITIRGTVPSIGINAQVDLLDAAFSENIHVTRYDFQGFTVAMGVHQGSADATLAAYFGEGLPAVEAGGMNLASTIASVGGGGTFSSTATLGGLATANVVPEPTTAFLLLLGLAGLGMAGRTGPVRGE